MTSHRDWPNVPFAPRKFRIGYHWTILGVGALGVVMSAPGQTIGVSAFTDTLIEVLGVTMGVVWPRYFGKEHLGKITGVSMAVMVSASAVAGVAVTIASHWADNPSERAASRA